MRKFRENSQNFLGSLTDPEETSEYIRKKFIEGAPPTKQIYVHKTTATDTNNIRLVFRIVKVFFLRIFVEIFLGIFLDFLEFF